MDKEKINKGYSMLKRLNKISAVFSFGLLFLAANMLVLKCSIYVVEFLTVMQIIYIILACAIVLVCLMIWDKKIKKDKISD